MNHECINFIRRASEQIPIWSTLPTLILSVAQTVAKVVRFLFHLHLLLVVYMKVAVIFSIYLRHAVLKELILMLQ